MSVFEQSGPIIAGSQDLMSGGVPHKISSSGTVMEFLQHFIGIFSFETSQQYPVIVDPEEY